MTGVTFVNVRDFGAVPGTDCAAAFQQAVDALDSRVGGTVFVPGADQSYLFSRSVIVDRDNVRIVGENPTTAVLETETAAPALIFGMKRAPRGRPLHRDHWVDLYGLADASAAPAPGSRWGYRTRVAATASTPASDATLSFPCSPFAFGPPDNTYWTGVRQLTVDFLVRNNAMPWANQQMFGMADQFDMAAPWHARIAEIAGTPRIVFGFRTTDGLHRDITVPFDASQPVLRCSLQLDLATGEVAAWVDHVEVAPDLAGVNDRWWPADRDSHEPTFEQNWYSPLNLGALTPSGRGWGPVGSLPGGPVDLTFGALRLSNIRQYPANGVGTPQTTAAGPVTDLHYLSVQDGVFGCLPMDESPPDPSGTPDPQVPWNGVYGAGRVWGRGLFVHADLDVQDTIAKNAVQKLTINCFRRAWLPGMSSYGHGIGVGFVYDFMVDDTIVQFGAQGLSNYNVGSNYPVEVRSCEFGWHTDAAIYSYYQIGRGDNLRLKYYGRSALKGCLSNLSYRNVFCTDSPSCESAVKLFQTFGQFDSWGFNFEGGSLPSDSYFWASTAWYMGGATLLSIRDCGGGAGSDKTAAVRLVGLDANAGLAHSARGSGWCTIERSFSNFMFPNLQAIVAVDGPLWQGTYQGIPLTRPPFVVNTATPGASARIGIGTVPAPVSVPPVIAAGGADFVADLPGLVGYYRADRLLDTSGPLHDGDPVLELTDLSGAGNHGKPVNSPAVYQTSAVNGLPAIQFTGGWYQFPEMHGSTGGVTVFFVAKRLPYFDTKPGQVQTLRTNGTRWQVVHRLEAASAESDIEWAVYAVRYTDGPARKLQTWANGHATTLRRNDGTGPVEWSTPTLGTVNTGWLIYRGQLTTAIICDGGLSDPDVQRVTRHLLSVHRIPV